MDSDGQPKERVAHTAHRFDDYGGEHGRSIDESVQHFYDKLLLIKDELNTDTARKIAEKRHAFLKDYLAELREELSK